MSIDDKTDKNSKKYIIIAEDDPMIRELMVQIVREETGHEVCGAANGAEALKEYSARRPDLVLTDGYMPVMDGWELKKHIRAQGNDVPIVLVTGRVFKGKDAELKNEFDDYLAKPFRIAQLNSCLKKYV